MKIFQVNFFLFIAVLRIWQSYCHTSSLENQEINFAEIDCDCDNYYDSTCSFKDASSEQLENKLQNSNEVYCRPGWSKSSFKELKLINYRSKVFPKIILQKLSTKTLNLKNLSIEIINEDALLDVYFYYELNLDLSFNKLQKVNMKSFYKLSNDEKRLNVNLEHNEISHIENFHNESYSNEIFLNFAYNRLKKVAIGNHVQSLNFSFNQISEISCDENVLNVQFLNLSHNLLIKSENFYYCMKKLINLKELDLSFNDIGTKMEFEEPLRLETFRALENLKKLSLAGNEFSSIPYGLFSGLKSLEFLDLSYNKLQTINFKRFWPLISLNTLDMSHNAFSSVYDFLHIKTFLKSVYQLGLEGHDFSCECLVHLMEKLKNVGISILEPKNFISNQTNINRFKCADENRLNEEYCQLD